MQRETWLLNLPAILPWISGEDDTVVLSKTVLRVVDFDPRSLRIQKRCENINPPIREEPTPVSSER